MRAGLGRLRGGVQGKGGHYGGRQRSSPTYRLTMRRVGLEGGRHDGINACLQFNFTRSWGLQRVMRLVKTSVITMVTRVGAIGIEILALRIKISRTSRKRVRLIRIGERSTL